MRVGRAGGVGMVILLLWGGGGPGPSGSVLLGSTRPPSALSGAHAPAAASAAPSPLTDLESALSHLGYKPAQIKRAIEAVGPMVNEGAPLESLVRESLRHV